MKKHFCLLTALLSICPAVVLAQPTSTWETIQNDIFNQNCIVCHREGTTFAVQSGLILTPDTAYENIIDVAPKNRAAREDGLVRVSSEGTVAAPHKSFLWEKINAPNQTHFYQDHPEYGSLMPLGSRPLTNGEIVFVEKWIEAGAPREGTVVDVALLDDTTRYREPEFAPLPKPERGMQFHLGPFDVWASEKWDREFLYYVPQPTTEDLYVKRYEIAMRPGSHHFIIYNYPDGVATPEPYTFRDMRDQYGNHNLENLIELGNLFPFRFFVGTQVPYINYSFPEGVALRLPAGFGFDLNSHSVNRSGEPRIGEIYTNLYMVERSEIEHVAEYDNFGNYAISLPPNEVTTLTHEGYFEETRHIIQMWSHSHEHTLEFRIEGIGGEHDGELLYWTDDWEHAPLLRLEEPLTMHAGEGLRLITTYNNWTNETIKFGPLSSDEMQFVFYIYYTDDTTDVEDDLPVPAEFALLQNYPNPFNAGTTIRYDLAQETHVRLQVFNTLGQEIATLVNGVQAAKQNHSVTFETEGLPSGVYFYRLEAGGHIEVRKMLLMR